MDKTYEATARLGATSSTFDPEGTITEFVEAHGNAPEGVPPYALHDRTSNALSISFEADTSKRHLFIPLKNRR